MLCLNLMSIFVENPQEALDFYTTKLGFLVKTIHKSINYVTVGTEDDGIELILESNTNYVAKNYQQVLYKQGLTALSLFTDNLDKECKRLRALDVKFIEQPSEEFGVYTCVIDDEQGNLVRIIEEI